MVVAGLVVGFIVGLTGVGGGSLMTPILLWFGISPTTAVGTDLLYAAFTKMGGIFVHNKKKNINWSITGWLSLGSIPAAMLTLWILHNIKSDISVINSLIKYSLGWALLFTSISILFKKKLLVLSQKHAGDKFHSESKTQNGLTVAIGVLLGVTVTLTSIGGVHDTSINIAKLSQAEQIGSMLRIVKTKGGGLIDGHSPGFGRRVYLLAGMQL